ncbi:MAG: hypothetical protein KIT68_07680 [Phycisphaeraceae bacterium]|nr:hypothetical protein [Phycisphaeraceae bacterium]
MRMLRAVSGVIACLGLAGAAATSGCAPSKPGLTEPEVLVAPYQTGGARVLWAVAPLRNESGTSAADAMMVSDALAARAAEIRGVSCLPVNRTVAAMRTLRMPSVSSPADARRLAQALGCDGILVGTITAYDPYDPPTLGLTVGLYGRDGSAIAPAGPSLDVRELRTAGADATAAASAWSEQPLSVAAEHLDSKNHEVLMNLRRYAEGRHDPTGPMGWRKYTASMDLYSEFAAFWTLRRLLDQERLRLARPGPPDKPTAR